MGTGFPIYSMEISGESLRKGEDYFIFLTSLAMVTFWDQPIISWLPAHSVTSRALPFGPQNDMVYRHRGGHKATVGPHLPSVDEGVLPGQGI